MHTSAPPTRLATALSSPNRAPDAGFAASGTLPDDRDFRVMCSAYRASGGVQCADDLARLLEEHRCGDFISLARFIARHEVFAFEWRETLWVPMFQFDLHDLSIRPGLQHVLAELAPVFDGQALAMWFAQPNDWLHGERPVDLLNTELDRVLLAAGADRVVANG